MENLVKNRKKEKTKKKEKVNKTKNLQIWTNFDQFP